MPNDLFQSVDLSWPTCNGMEDKSIGSEVQTQFKWYSVVLTATA